MGALEVVALVVLYVAAGLVTAIRVTRFVNEPGHGFKHLTLTPQRVVFVVAFWPVFVTAWLAVYVWEPLMGRKGKR